MLQSDWLRYSLSIFVNRYRVAASNATPTILPGEDTYSYPPPPPPQTPTPPPPPQNAGNSAPEPLKVKTISWVVFPWSPVDWLKAVFL